MKKAGAAAASALCLAACFPSGSLWWLAWVALTPLLWSCSGGSRRTSFFHGYAAGFLFFFLTLFWIHHVTVAGLLLLSAYLALYWGVFALAAAMSTAWPLWRRCVFLPCAWVALEYVRAEAFSGFGWSALAHTQAANILFIQGADITGTYGLSFILVAVNTAAAGIGMSWRQGAGLPDEVRRAMWGVVLLVCLSLGYGAWRLHALADARSGAHVRVGLVQPNISLADYTDPGLKSFVVEKHLAMSRTALQGRPQIIIWPETAFPQFIWEYPDLEEKIRAFARENRVNILFGVVTREGGQYFNAARLINVSGEDAGVYHKQHLVVLGEYIPFRRELPILGSLVPIDDFTPGQGSALFAMGKGVSLAPLICFEDTVPALVRAAAAQGAGFLVNMTNDAWFGASRQPVMHLDNAVFRAVENRVSLVRATNTGMTCSVAPEGEVSGCVRDMRGRAVMAEGVSVTDITLAGPSRTFYTKYGDLFARLCFLGILGMIGIAFDRGFGKEAGNV